MSIYTRDTLTIIRVVIHSLKICDLTNYMSIYTWVYSKLYELVNLFVLG